MVTQSPYRHRLPLALLLAVVVGCGGGGGPTSPASQTAGEPPGGSSALDGDRTATGPGDAAGAAHDTAGATAPTAEPPQAIPSDLGLPVGTEPPFAGAPYDETTFPLDEMISVLPQDAIPAVTDPPMVRQDQVGYLADDDLVFGVAIRGDARAYPHNIGWWHEVVNDVVGGRAVSVTFCPLTGTGLVFDGEGDDGERVTFGVSGWLYNTNLVMYSRTRPSTLYPQIYAAGVRGPQTGRALRLLPVVETTWRTWRRLYPDTQVIAVGPYGTSRYTQYPYGDYRTNDDDFLFPIRPRLASNPNPYARQFDTKDLVLGVRVDGQAMAFPFKEMFGPKRRVINQSVGGLEIAVVYDSDARLAIPYARRVDGRVLTFDLVDEGTSAFVFSDRETGTRWDVKGLGRDGELAGHQLTQVPAHNAMWFAWVTFWPNTEVWTP